MKAAFEHPRDIDRNLVDAQQARRVLDRLVGYQVSPLLVGQGTAWPLRRTRSDRRSAPDRRAGTRNQGVHQERVLDHRRSSRRPQAACFRCPLPGQRRREDRNHERRGSGENSRRAGERRLGPSARSRRKERRRNATPPFTTSKLQQDSSRKLRFSVKRTMMIAQRLYEGIELGEEGLVGLITYMRTDSHTCFDPTRSRKSASTSPTNTAPNYRARVAQYI